MNPFMSDNSTNIISLIGINPDCARRRGRSYVCNDGTNWIGGMEITFKVGGQVLKRNGRSCSPFLSRTVSVSFVGGQLVTILEPELDSS